MSNDYFDRSKDPGSFRLFINGKESEDAAINLWNGFANLNVKIENCKVGDIIHFKSEVFDVSRSEPIVEEFFVNVIAPLTGKPANGGKRKSPSSTTEGTESKKPEGFALPNIIEVSKDGRSGHSWQEQSFNETSALLVKGNEEDGYDFFVNIDNIHLLTELKPAHSNEIKAIEAKYKFGLVLIGIALLNEEASEQKTNGDDDKDVLKIISATTKALSPIIIPMINTLGALELESIMSMQEEAL